MFETAAGWPKPHPPKGRRGATRSAALGAERSRRAAHPVAPIPATMSHLRYDPDTAAHPPAANLAER